MEISVLWLMFVSLSPVATFLLRSLSFALGDWLCNCYLNFSVSDILNPVHSLFTICSGYLGKTAFDLKVGIQLL